MSSFSLSEVAWKETAILNVARSIAASIVWFLVILLVSNTFALALLTFPIQYLLFFAPIGIFCSYVSRIFPFVGLITLVLAISIVVGDPVICLITSLKPGLLPVDNYPPFNFVLIMYVLKS
jgi:hypothetical protein